MRWVSDQEVDVFPSPSEFVFRGRHDEVRLAPVIWLDAAGRKVLGVGDAKPLQDGAVRVALFAPAPGDPRIDRHRLLVMFLRQVMYLFLAGTFIKVKPRLRFHGIGAMSPMLAGFERELFERAAKDAGAREVAFVD